MTLFQLLVLLYLLGAFHCLAAAAKQCMVLRNRFVMAEEVLVALFWPLVLGHDIFIAWKVTKKFPGRW